MKILFPAYYKDFRCIADRCRHSCCVGWEIDVDSKTLERYRHFDGMFGEEILSHISGESPVIELCEDERCPFLDCHGLCRIISAHGEDAVSMICREHPRFYHCVGGRIEGGIGAVCEEACRIILSSDGYKNFIELDREIETPDEVEFDSSYHRNYIFLALEEGNYAKAMKKIMDKYSIPDPIDMAEEWNEILSHLEYLDENRIGKLTVGRKNNNKDLDKYFTRFLAYLVFRHVSIAESYDNLCARIGFCILLARVLENLTSEGELTFNEVCEFSRIISEEIEYSEDNTASLIFEFESKI